MEKSKEMATATTPAKKPTKAKKPASPIKKQSLIMLAVLAVLSIGAYVVLTFVIGYKKDMDYVSNSVFPETAFYIAGMPISESVISAWITMGIIITLLVLFRLLVFPKFKQKPQGILQIMSEYIVTTFDEMSHSKVGHHARALGPVALAMAAFIFFGTMLEMLGIRPPSADINTCAGMAITTFLFIHVYGLMEKGFKKRALRNLAPIPIIPLITDIAVPVSMTFRQFGAILSGYIIMNIIYVFIAPVVPAFLSIMFTVFHAVIQAFIFATLTLTFVGEAVE